MASTSDPKPIQSGKPELQVAPIGLWWEVAAVLAFGIVPNLSNAVMLWLFPNKSASPYWADALDVVITNSCISFAVLYVIKRSGEAWATFGLVKPHVIDFSAGLVVAFVSVLSWRTELLLPPPDHAYQDLFPMPKSATDYLLLIPSVLASTFREELIVRAYLITRLERLLKSPMRAVLLAALVFASYHIYYGITGLIGPLLDGLIYGILYLVARRIWPFVIGHALFNIFQFLPLRTQP